MKTVKSKRPIIFYEDTRPNKEDFKRADIVDAPPMGMVTYVGGYKDEWTAFVKRYILTVMGPRIFWKSAVEATLTFKNGKLYGNLAGMIPTLERAFHLDWIRTNDWTRWILMNRKDLWQMILKGKITNPEDLCKTFSRKYFQRAYSYKAIKAYFSTEYRHARISLWDLFYYTTNPNEALMKVCERGYNYASLLSDMIRYCKYDNTKINPLWSDRRMQEEHQKQIERRDLQRIESIPNTPIIEPFSREGVSLILDERTCYLEANSMHNCIHGCYWPRVKKGNYLIAKGNFDGEHVDIGICYDRQDRLRIEQVHTIYNGTPLTSTKVTCLNWVKKYNEELKEVMRNIKGSDKIEHVGYFPNEEDIIPF